MIRRALSLALMLAAAPASAQLVERFPGATDAGVTVTLPNGKRAIVQATAGVDTTGAPVSPATSANQTNGNQLVQQTPEPFGSCRNCFDGNGKQSAGTLYALNVVSSTASGYVVVFDSPTPPNSGDNLNNVLYCMPLPASSGFDKSFVAPIPMSSGIQILFSTSCTTFTPPATAAILIGLQFK